MAAETFTFTAEELSQWDVACSLFGTQSLKGKPTSEQQVKIAARAEAKAGDEAYTAFGAVRGLCGGRLQRGDVCVVTQGGLLCVCVRMNKRRMVAWLLQPKCLCVAFSAERFVDHRNLLATPFRGRTILQLLRSVLVCIHVCCLVSVLRRFLRIVVVFIVVIVVIVIVIIGNVGIVCKVLRCFLRSVIVFIVIVIVIVIIVVVVIVVAAEAGQVVTDVSRLDDVHVFVVNVALT
jgi:hypothetical protein